MTTYHFNMFFFIYISMVFFFAVARCVNVESYGKDYLNESEFTTNGEPTSINSYLKSFFNGSKE